MDCENKFREFISANANADTAALRLKYAGRDCGFDMASALLQIDARRKFATKLPDTLAAFPGFMFPGMLAGEQCTSDALAAYHSSLVPQVGSVADLTAGLGIDALHMASRATQVVAVERDAVLADTLRHNAAGLKADNLEAVCDDCRHFVQECVERGRHFDVVFIDPARRGQDGKRVFALADCEPDVVSMLPQIRSICRMLIVKASPMLDISATIEALENPKAAIVLATPTECKELLMLVPFDSEQSGETMIEAVTVHGRTANTFAFTRRIEAAAASPATSPAIKAGNYIAEPSPAIMKAAPFKLLCERYSLRCFSNNTKLFFSDSPTDGFPGLYHRVIEVLPYSSSVIKTLARRYPIAEVAARNFGMSAEALRGRLKVRDGDAGVRIYGVTAANGDRLLIVTEK